MAKTQSRTMISRIDELLKDLAPPGKLRLSDRAASLRSGLSGDGIRTIRRQFASGKQTSIRTETLENLAAGLGTSTEWLLKGEGPRRIEFAHLDSESVLAENDTTRTVPTAGFVSAGAQAKFLPLQAGELDRVAAPPNSTEDTQCLEVRGNSLGELFDRWLVFYNDVRSPVTSDLVGKLCVVGLEDERVMVKKITREKGEFVLRSNTEPPIRGVRIIWAARVFDMRPQ